MLYVLCYCAISCSGACCSGACLRGNEAMNTDLNTMLICIFIWMYAYNLFYQGMRSLQNTSFLRKRVYQSKSSANAYRLPKTLCVGQIVSATILVFISLSFLFGLMSMKTMFIVVPLSVVPLLIVFVWVNQKQIST